MFRPLMIAAGCLFVATIAAAADRPNVLFIAVDDLRPELGCYGVKHIHSPNIDRIAARGVTFTRAYCQQAVCSPSRTSLMTGARPDTTKVWDLNTHFRKAMPDVITLGQQFKRHGYHVAGMGKIYHGGFDDQPTWSEPWQRPTGVKEYAIAQTLELVARKRAAAKARGLDGTALSRAARGPATESADVPDETYHDGALAAMAVKKLGELKQGGKPFFLAVGFVKPHLPFVAPKKYWDLYDPAKIALPDNPHFPKNAPSVALLNSTGEMSVYEGIPREIPLPDDLTRHLRHGYYAAVSYMDAQVGRILDELDRLGLADDTIIVLWGDHGWKLGEHAMWCKHTNYELDANAPLLVAAPGVVGGRRSDRLVEFVDIYPTLCELAGLPLPDHLEGTSFVPLLRDPQRSWKTAAFSQYPRGSVMGYAMRTERYRFVRWQKKNKPDEVVAYELYDHASDPAENVNVADDPRHAQLVKDLDAQCLAGWQAARPR